MRRPRPCFPPAAAAVAAVLGLAACGIPTDDSPRVISRENVPDAVEPTTRTAPEVTAPARLFLVQSPDDPRLVEVERDVSVESPSARPTPDAVLEALLAAEPDATEREAGIVTLIPQDTRLASPPELLGTTLVIDLTRVIFDDVQGEPQRAAFGQIVCTADELAGVDSVRFRVDGDPAEAQADSGATDRPVTCDRDYRRLLAGGE